MNSVVYKTNPIAQVIFQIRFETIPNIEEYLEKAVDIAKDDYVEYQKDQGSRNLSIFNQNSAQASVPKYVFVSKDNIHRIVLSRNSISVSTFRYTDWNLFYHHISIAINILSTIKTNSAIRIGLRYINLLNSDDPRFNNNQYYDLINCGLLDYLKNITDPSASYSSTYEYSLEGGIKNRLKLETVRVGNSTKNSLLLDLDYFYSSPMKQSEYCSFALALHKCSDTLINKLFTDKMKETLNR